MSFTHDAEIPPFVPLEEPPIAEMAREYSPIMEAFAKVDPVLAAATFGALLAWPELHANVIRLEALVHLALAYSVGHEPPSTALVKESFDRLNEGYSGLAEDPAENVFVTLVSTSRGNFRIFQGIRESPGFFLQRLLNVVETIPYDGPFTHLHESINALLK